LGVALALHSGSTLALAMMWTPLVMARAGREFSNWLAVGPLSFIVVSEP